MLPSKMSQDELLSAANLGRVADDFAKYNDLYVRHILPAIAKAATNASEDGDWKPGKTVDPVAISIYNAYNAGRKAEFGFIASVLARLVKDGIEAQKELERRDKGEKK